MRRRLGLLLLAALLSACSAGSSDHTLDPQDGEGSDLIVSDD